MLIAARLGSAATSLVHSGTPFSVSGATNVVLETVKRGEDDKEGKDTTLILRLFEQYGGHANAVLKM